MQGNTFPGQHIKSLDFSITKIFRIYLLDDCDLSQISSCAAFYQRDISCQTHPVYMVTSRYRDKNCVTFLIIWDCKHIEMNKKKSLGAFENTSIIQSIHYQHKLSEELHIVVGAVKIIKIHTGC